MKRVVLGMMIVAAGAGSLWAQGTEGTAPEAGSSGESTETKVSRDGTTYRTWEELVADWLTPRPVPKDLIVRIDDKYAYPHAAVSFKMEIVKEEGDMVWLRGIPPEDPESAIHDLWLRREHEEMAYRAALEWEDAFGSVEYYVDFAAEIVPPPFMDSLRFEPKFDGLPNRGLWQMNFAADDMDGDGNLDLVFPPSRKGNGRPTILRGDGSGGFTFWKGLRWASDVPLDYGGVDTGDFNGDGLRDIVIAIHFKGQYVFLGDGKGGFTQSQVLPSPDPRVTSRAPVVADFNGDGRDDVAFLAEINYDMGTSQPVEGVSTIWVAANHPSGWKLENKGLPGRVIGDAIAAADLDGDGRTDLVVASNSTDWRRLVYFNREDEGWVGPLPSGLLTNAQHPDVEVVLSNGKAEVYAPFIQFLTNSGRTLARTGLVRYEVTPDGILERGAPLVMDDQRYDPWFRVGTGDLNGDGRTDMVAARKDGTVSAFVQTDSGDFYLEESPDLTSFGRAYDIQLIDLDGDGLDDVVICFADETGGQGGVKVWVTKKKSE